MGANLNAGGDFLLDVSASRCSHLKVNVIAEFFGDEALELRSLNLVHSDHVIEDTEGAIRLERNLVVVSDELILVRVRSFDVIDVIIVKRGEDLGVRVLKVWSH